MTHRKRQELCNKAMTVDFVGWGFELRGATDIRCG
jgi:hypothetical protein